MYSPARPSPTSPLTFQTDARRVSGFLEGDLAPLAVGGQGGEAETAAEPQSVTMPECGVPDSSGSSPFLLSSPPQRPRADAALWATGP